MKSYLSLSVIQLISYYISISNAQTTEGSLRCGDTVRGSINLRETHYYSVPLPSNYDSIGFEGCLSNFDIDLRLNDNEGNEIAQEDEFGTIGSQNGCGHIYANDLLIEDVSAGNYLFSVGGYLNRESGNYVIELICSGGNTVPTPTPVSQSLSVRCNERITGETIAGNWVNYNVILTEQYSNIKFDGCLSNFDLDLRLTTPGETELARDAYLNGPKNGCNHQWATDLEYGPIDPGSYIFGIKDWNDRGGEYSILLQCITTTAPPTDECPDGNHRFRKSWLEMSQTERNLYIRGFSELASEERGVIQQFTRAHLQSAIHGAAAFLPWHRHFVYLLETEIRNLGGEFSCFAMPYWDWAAEPTPSESNGNWRNTLEILNSGLGGDSSNQCLNDGSLFSNDNYDPVRYGCLVRDLDYTTDGISDCSFTTHSSIMGNFVDRFRDFESFRTFEQTPHGLPHVCIGGGGGQCGDGNDGGCGQMRFFHSPDDPIFYLHHTFIDYVYALWQDCQDYDGRSHTSFSNLYSGSVNTILGFGPLSHPSVRVSDTFDIINDYGYSYEKGDFWSFGNVEDGSCGVPAVSTNQPWFTHDVNRRRMSGELTVTDTDLNKVKRNSDGYAMDIYDLLVGSTLNNNEILNNQIRINGNGDNKNKNNNGVQRKDISYEWAKMVCEQEEYEKGKTCHRPSGKYNDCAGMKINPSTNDIDITLNELLSKEGITKCMKETRQRFYGYAKDFGYLKYLCVGCFDPFCDKTGLEDICTNINSHYL